MRIFLFLIGLILLLTLTLSPTTHSKAEKILPENDKQIELSFAPIVKKSAPAVVNIYTKRIIERRFTSPFAHHPFFSPFFENRELRSPLRRRVENSLGSGFILRANGLVVTNAHVIENADEIYAILHDGREYKANIALVDTRSDIALLKLEKQGSAPLPFLELHSSEETEVGDLVLAIGNPFGVGQSVTSGIISALARSSTNISDYDFFIQTDAAINPGNSGGPLINLQGKAIGLNTAIYSRSGGSMGIGFSIPSEMINAILTSYDQGQSGHEGIIRPWSGFEGQAVTAEIASSLGFSSPQGALVANIYPDSPAQQAGLQQGDLIKALNDKQISNLDELNFRIATLPLNSNVTLTISRQNKKHDITFKIIAPPEIPAKDMRTLKGKHPLSGAQIVNLSPAVIHELSIKSSRRQGVAISEISSRSIASRLGLRRGDIIISINDKEATSTADLYSILDSISPSPSWSIVIQRDEQIRTLYFR